MDKKGWKRKITNQCKEAGTYQLCFISVIDILAETMALRDDALNQYYNNDDEEIRQKTVVTHKNKADNENLVKNPALAVIEELTKISLSYWRELGLTPKSFDSLGSLADEKQNNDIFAGLIDGLDI